MTVKSMMMLALMAVSVGTWAEGEAETASPETPVSELDFESVKARAENGDVAAMDELSMRYRRGMGVRVNNKEANRWIMAAASNGNERAIGVCYSEGLGVEKDFKEAFKWYRKAADKGDLCAMNNVWAWCLGSRRAQHIEEEEFPAEEAMRLLRFAADRGLGVAMTNLGSCYEVGTMVEKDEIEAVKWYRKAAEKGDAIAINRLVRYYDQEAEKWRQRASGSGLYVPRRRTGEGAAIKRSEGDSLRSRRLRRMIDEQREKKERELKRQEEMEREKQERAAFERDLERARMMEELEHLKKEFEELREQKLQEAAQQDRKDD